jgi:hypothetical protein
MIGEMVSKYTTSHRLFHFEVAIQYEAGRPKKGELKKRNGTFVLNSANQSGGYILEKIVKKLGRQDLT